jgi:hypothetical protein
MSDQHREKPLSAAAQANIYKQLRAGKCGLNTLHLVHASLPVSANTLKTYGVPVKEVVVKEKAPKNDVEFEFTTAQREFVAKYDSYTFT